MDKAKRNAAFDLMRCFGIAAIMIAHSDPPDWLFQLRNFGTPLLVVASGLAYWQILSNRDVHWMTFIIDRLKRLLVPTWIFLTIFFVGFYIGAALLGREYPFTKAKIMDAFMLGNSIGYLWIIRIYVLLAFFTPICLYLARLRVSNWLFSSALIVIYGSYELYFELASQIGYSAGGMYLTWLPYVLLYAYAMRLSQASLNQLIVLSAIAFTIFLVIATSHLMRSGQFIQTQLYKYPPRFYYLTYALGCIHLIYAICKILTEKFANISLVEWLSKRIFWIYLWHIFAIYAWPTLFSNHSNESTYLFKIIGYLSFGIFAAWCQWTFVAFWNSKGYRGSKFTTKYF